MEQGAIATTVGRGDEDAGQWSAPERTALDARAEELFLQRYDSVLRRTDRLFAWLMLGQWVAAIGFAYWLSPYAWEGRHRVVHEHVYAALVLGGLITVFPVSLAFLRPGQTSTRYFVACGQMLWSALLIHLTGGRIETHFHVFGSLAILAFYRDLRVLVPATIVVAADHLVRGLYWPESVYGVANPEWWRFLEHAGWVMFIDIFLIRNCMQAYEELVDLTAQQAKLEKATDRAVRMERLAATGQLAASVGHELRNPLAAVRNAHTYISRHLRKSGDVSPRVQQFLGIMERELDASAKIISNLLDFSRVRGPTRTPCPLRPLVDLAVEVIPNERRVSIVNSVPEDLPIPSIDQDQFRQVLINLIQNAVEAVADREDSEVVVTAEGGGKHSWSIRVSDNGPGFEPGAADRLFQPLFSTKTKGTGLGLAVVQNLVEGHGGTIRAQASAQGGAEFVIELPTNETLVADAAE